MAQLDLAVEDVARDLEIGRARRAGEAFARRHRDHVGDALGRADAGREFGDRPHQVDMWQILQRTHHVLRQRALAADMQHRAFGAERRRDAGNGVGAAWACRGHHAAELAGLPRITVGRMRRHLFVANVDDADAFVDAAVIDVDDMAAAQSEDRVHALVLQRPRNQVAAGDDIGIAALARQSVVRGGTGSLGSGVPPALASLQLCSWTWMFPLLIVGV